MNEVKPLQWIDGNSGNRSKAENSIAQFYITKSALKGKWVWSYYFDEFWDIDAFVCSSMEECKKEAGEYWEKRIMEVVEDGYKANKGVIMAKEYIERRDWKELKDSGLLWFVNRTLHLFGYAIVFDVDDETKEIKEVYFARCKFRGFSEKSDTKGFKNMYKYLKDNLDTIEKDMEE
jgi:hypothetical protein